MKINPILNVDSYKTSHFGFMENGTTKIFSYIESRVGGSYKSTVFFGLQFFLKEYLSTRITMEMVDEAETFIMAHGEPFNRSGWEYIVKHLNGKIPLRIKAVPEGTVVPEGNVLVTVENTDPNCAWVSSYFETALLRAVWYPSTVATRSKNLKEIITNYLYVTGNPDLIDYKLIDFGARGCSSLESSMISGAAHLVNFLGTDNIAGIHCAQKYYNTKEMVGFSIPASEHSVTTSWGVDREEEFFSHAIDTYGGPGKMISLVADSYDLFNAINILGTKLKQKIIDNGCTIVVRPDSGDPVKMVLRTVETLANHFGFEYNTKGYKVLHPSVRVIQGDGINENSVDEILQTLALNKYSADNVTFGCGGYLLQQLNRDTQRFAMKASSVVVNGERRDICKTPKTDLTKASKKGRITLISNVKGISTKNEEDVTQSDIVLLKTVFENGEVINEYPFNEVRKNASHAISL